MFTPAQSHSQTLLEHYDYAIVCIEGLIFVCMLSVLCANLYYLAAVIWPLTLA